MRIRLSAYALAIVFCLTAAYQTQGQMTISPPVRELSADGGSGYILTSGTGSWTAHTTADWISIQPRKSGNAEESCIYVVRKNISSEPRDAQIFINDNVHTVIQYGSVSKPESKTVDTTEITDKPVVTEKPQAEYNTPAPAPVTPVSNYQAPTPIAKSESTYRTSAYTPPTSSSAYVSPSGQLEVRAGVNMYIPNGAAATGSTVSELQTVDWDRGLGFEIQGIYWFDTAWGAGLSIGTAKWDIKDYYHKRYNSTYRINEYNTLEGDASLVIFGASVFRKINSGSTIQSKWTADIEAGIRYASIDSNISGLYVQEYADAYVRTYQDIETDKGVLAIIALNGGYKLTDKLSFMGQVGIQADLSKGEVINNAGRFSGEAGETELQAIFTRLGLSYTF